MGLWEGDLIRIIARAATVRKACDQRETRNGKRETPRRETGNGRTEWGNWESGIGEDGMGRTRALWVAAVAAPLRDSRPDVGGVRFSEEVGAFRERPETIPIMETVRKSPGLAGWFAFGWAAIVGAGLVFVPVYGTAVSTGGGLEGSGANWFSGTLLDVAGPAGLVFLLLPLAATTIPLVSPRAIRRRVTVTSAVVVGLYALLGLMSFGLLHVPTAVALLVEAVRAEPQGPSG
jgi:hypothetical protein